MTPKDIVAFAIVILMVIAAVACVAVCIHWCVEMFRDGDWAMGIITIGFLIMILGVIVLKLIWGE